MNGARPLAVGVTPLETRREVVLHVATRAKQLGYDAFFLAEGWGHDAAALLAEVATRTTRIRLGTGVLNVWGRSAAGVAMLAASLADISDGRFTLGLGAGSPQLAEGLHDVAFQSPVERLGAMVRQVRRLLGGARVEPTVAGASPLRLAVKPASDIPIYLAGLGPKAVRLCGELGDGWCPFLLPISAVDHGVALLAEGAARDGTGRALPAFCPCLPTAVAPEPAQARDLASWWVAFYLTSMGALYRSTLQRMGFAAAVQDVLAANVTRGSTQVPDSAGLLLDELTLWGDLATARARLDSWYAAGADMPVLSLPPNRSLSELDFVLDGLQPAGRS